MASSPKVTLNGIPLGGAASYGWPLRAGTMPHREFWTVTRRRAEQDITPLLGKPQTFRIEGPRDTYEVQDLYPLRLLPNANPNLATLEVVDKRWLVSRMHLSKSFNVRRITGRKRFNDDGGNLQEENAVFNPDVEFAAYSLYLEEEPWTPRSALSFVLLSLFGAKFDIADPFDSVTQIRDVIIDDNGSTALAIILNEFPGAALYIDREGTAVVYDQTSRKEKNVFAGINTSQQDVGTVAENVDNRYIRPSRVEVLFTPEIEVRADATTTQGTRTRGRFELDPIAQSVDGRLSVVDPVTGAQRVAGLGSWEHASALYTAWGGFGAKGRTLSNDILAKHAASGFKLVEWEFATTASGAPDDQSVRRIQSAVSSYRRDFAVDQEAFSKLASLRPHRVAILNRLFGTRAPSPVYTDWIRIPTWKGLVQADKRAWDVLGGVGSNEPLSGGQKAPALVYEIAPGMFHVEPRQQDWGGMAQATFFGRPTDQVPISDMGGNANRTGSDYLAVFEALELKAAFRLSTILTAVPGLPNDNRKLHKVEVTPDQAAAKMGTSVGPSEGPPITIRVPTSLMTAKFAYNDARRDYVEDVVLGDVPVQDAGLEDLLVNPDFVKDFAEAAAAVVYTQYLDRPRGTASVDLTPGIAPEGSISQVRHEMVGGITRTVISFDEPAQLASVYRFLDQGIRRAIMTGGEAATPGPLVTGVR